LYTQWYKSPDLADGKHTIRVSGLATTSVDFAVVTAGENTPLSGKTVVVDNESAAISYSGAWTRNEGQINVGTLPDGRPYGNSTHRTSSVGDSMSFRFTGELSSSSLVPTS